MQLMICGLNEVGDLKRQHKVTKILSLTEFVVPNYIGEGVEHTRIIVDDIEHGDSKIAPSTKVIDTIVAFARTLKEDDVIIIHCFAGISRSTAAALIVMVEKGANPEAAAEFVRKIRPIAAPNRMLCKLADQYFGTYFGEGPLYKIADRMNNERGFRMLVNNKLYG